MSPHRFLLLIYMAHVCLLNGAGVRIFHYHSFAV